MHRARRRVSASGPADRRAGSCHLASIFDETGGDLGPSRRFAVERRLGLSELKLGHLTDVGARPERGSPTRALGRSDGSEGRDVKTTHDGYRRFDALADEDLMALVGDGEARHLR